MAFSKTKTIETPTVGRELRQARTERSMGIDELAEETKIQPRYLRALEKGNIEALPAPVYVRGFLRRIARPLHLDAEKLFSLYERDRRIANHLNGGSPHQDRPLGLSGRSPFSITPKAMSIGIAVIIVVAVIGYVGTQLESFIAPPTLVVEQPSGNEVLLSNIVTVTGRTEPDARLTVNGEDVYVEDQGFFEIELPVEEGMNTIHVRAENRLGKVSEEVRQVVLPINGTERRGEQETESTNE